ncbi:MAG: type II toxin-antitoxin system Phd/YefM family antitoxin [Deltaproteobacteria bacterium]|jgi:prevent-host-death family protein|nr:type II toxin-antitoxin system Phd/YefM family antitoxin [Deltaproteobacteria bacterium]
MKDTTVSIAEGKKGFSRLIQGALDNKEKIIITKRRKPVAVIIPYDEYQRSMRFEGYKKIMEVREAFLQAGVKAKDVYKESKKQLEGRF